MDKLIAIILAFAIGVLQAQPSENRGASLAVENIEDHSLILGVEEASKYALNWINLKQDFSINNGKLRLIALRKTNYSIHYRFQLIVNNLPVYGAQIKISTSSDGRPNSIMAVNHIFDSIISPNNNSNQYYLSGNTLLPVYNVNSVSNSGLSNTSKLVNEIGDTLLEIDLNSYDSDTTANVQVFYPEPITSAKTIYGVPYNDANDAINSQLLAEHFIKPMPLTFRDDTFRLESEYFKMNEHSLPIEKVWTGTSNSIIYNRSELYFEQINIFYHLSRFRAHMDSLGYGALGKRQINIDAHGFAGSDASAYSSNFTPPRLTFGQGGVDDGEDPGIIVHEYTHSLTDFAAPTSNLGFQRNAIDEGISDYVAASYIKEISNYHFEQIFKWDGHNEFWVGRTINFNQKYPKDTSGTSHKAGGILSTVLMKLNDKIGRINTDKLAFEIMYDFMPLMTYPDLAKSMVKAEKQLFNEKYKKDVCDILWTHGMKNACYVGIETVHTARIELIVLNSEGFTYGAESVQIILPTQENHKYHVLDSKGQILKTGTSDSRSLDFSPNTFNSGIYFVHFPESNFKIVRLVVL